MKGMSVQAAAKSVRKVAVSDQAVKALASSIYQQLQQEGCETRDIISVSSQLIDLVTAALQKDEATQ